MFEYTGSLDALWSIGIYEGESPLRLRPPEGVNNPILSCRDVADVRASFVADPFMIRVGDDWLMFFEVMNREARRGEIGLAASGDGVRWTYRQIVLREPYHLSYPHVFGWRDEYYMIPEAVQSNSVRLYRATRFPTEWAFVTTLLEGVYADPSVFRFDGRWWMFACSTPYGHDTLRLYFADDLAGAWTEHPSSPIVSGNARTARPGGRVLVMGDRVVRFSQDCYALYGNSVRAFEISELTTAGYREREAGAGPILAASGAGWNGAGMHHVDAHLKRDGQWIACVDGLGLA